MFWSNFAKTGSRSAGRFLLRRSWFAMGMVLLALTACATNRALSLSETVGPKEAAGGFAAKGILVVYSETEDINDGGIVYHPHTGYGLFTPEGKRIRSIMNRVGDTDQEPMNVILPAGKYLVKARAAGFGVVSIPVAVLGGKRTALYLERQGMPDAADLATNAVVRLPGGPVIGWRARDISKP